MTVNEDIEGDRRRAEVFDALGHPTRIMILKALGEGALGFADLKKKTGIVSSGHLQHHLGKLGSLVKTDEYGKYCLSDEGKDALLTVQTVENVVASDGESGKTRPRAKGLRNKTLVKTAVVGLAFLLLASFAFGVYEYSQTRLLQNQVSQSILAINQQQDLGRIQIVKSNPNVGMGFSFRTMLVGNDTSEFKPYTLWVDILVQIRNPTPYNVTLQLQGDLNITLSGQESGDRVWNGIRYFSVPMYSDTNYDFSLYRGGSYSDQNAVEATVNNCEVYVTSAHVSE